MKMIFIIDDDEAFQKLMNHHLTNMGFAVRSVFSGKELDDIDETPFLIILDHHFGDDDHKGLFYLKRIRHDMASIPVIYMTIDKDRQVRSDAKKAGAYAFIEKDPSSFRRLEETIDRLMRNPYAANWFSRTWSAWITSLRS